MSSDTLTIQIGLPLSQLWDAGQIFFEAFKRKKQPFLGSYEQILSVFSQVIHPEQALIGLELGRLLGIAGLQHRQQPFFDPTWRIFVRTYGWFQALIRYPIARMMNHPAAANELFIDFIAVHPAARGKGVGSQLLEATLCFAREQGYQSVGLDVINTNQRARALYERFGFVVTKKHAYPYLQKSLGFNAVYTMSHTLEVVACQNRM